MEQIKEMERIESLTAGAYDLHIHPSPSHVERLLDDIQVYQAAAAHRMGGVVLKCHYEPTGARAQLVNRHFKMGETQAIGSVVLNWPTGGLNPYCVESACRMGARMIWMPTRDSKRSLSFGDMPGDFFQRPGITVLDEAGKLLPSVYEIFEIARRYDVPVCTGHLGMEESVLLCREGRSLGNKMVLTHPEWSRTTVPLQVQKELAEKGVFIEKCWLNIAEKDTTEEYMFHTVRELGCHCVFITTDTGKTTAPPPLEGYQDMLGRLLNNGFSEEEIRVMSRENPLRLIS